ncbi:MAG: hypothetical protein HKN79_00380 [Flavobacteriales bacterium]|nr:hypothetical protein [Flavobacteriales bacterium]
MKSNIIHTDKHEREVIDDLQAVGYTASYRLVDGKLRDLNSKKDFSRSDIIIDQQYRFEGMTNPDDLSILYALSMSDGSKGTLVLAYGPQGDSDVVEFMKDVEMDSHPD